MIKFDKGKNYLSYLLLSCLLLLSVGGMSGCADVQPPEWPELSTEAYIGMSRLDFEQLVPFEECQLVASHFLYTDSNGQKVVVKMDKEFRAITEIKVFEDNDAKPKSAAFQKIEEGMTLFEVLDWLGYPPEQIQPPSIVKSNTIVYESTDGEQIKISFFADNQLQGDYEYRVSSISITQPNFGNMS